MFHDKMKAFLTAMLLLAGWTALHAQSSTLRLDYIFTGSARSSEISLDEMSCFAGWAGRRHNMDSVALRGNGQIRVSDLATGKVLYKQSFSTLFQEWQATEEATRVRRSFENVFLVPMPSERAEVMVEIYDFYGNVSASLKHVVDPHDILIRQSVASPAPHRYMLHNGSPEECIDVAIVAEGYTESEAEQFYLDARTAMESILAHKPFDRYQDSFNFVAVALPSHDSGVSVPGEGDWRDTALKAHFNTFYMDRYLTTLRLKNLHDSLSGIPYEHIIILANTDTYGGGGIYNSYTLTTARHKAFKPVVVHEFGHSFAGLADEYFYDDMYVEYYYPEAEPWEQNITTLKDFDSKWKDMLDAGEAELLEGGGYQSKGVWRGAKDCRMHTNAADAFCPVCQRAISRLIEFYME